MLNKFFLWIERLYLAIATILFIALIAVVLLQVIARPLPVSAPAWTEEVARFLLVYLVAFGCALATSKRELVNVDLIVNMLPYGLRQALMILIDLLVIGCSVTLFFNSFEYVEHSSGRIATTVPIPMSWITASVLLICANLTIFTVVNLVRDIVNLKNGDSNHHTHTAGEAV